MSNRNYNVFFNAHTVSGIVISVALYIIFFAGAFAFFKDEIEAWEEGTPLSKTEKINIDYDTIFKELDSTYQLTGRDLQLNFGHNSNKIRVFISASKDSLNTSKEAKTSHFFYKDIITKDEKTYQENYNLGEFLYRLHFLDQLPVLGRYLAGFVALFFLFAIVTGVIVHWKKIIPNFYSFNPKIALKRVWTDAHTALGVIGLPFQFIFAVTGCYFILSILVLIPANFLYGGDQNKLMADLRPARGVFEWTKQTNQTIPSFNDVVIKTENRWDDFHVNRAFIKNYGGENMKFIINGELETNKRFIGVGSITYNALSGEIENIKNPNQVSYIQDSQFVFGRLHFANFGGYPVKTVYFILAFITCFVIITGVLIWIEARNKKSMSLKQRLYTAKVGHIYLAICLSMFPITALAFIFARLSHGYFTDKTVPLYAFYFLMWLVAILYFRFKRNNYYTNKTTLLSGAVIGLSIPIVNGLSSGNWLFKTLANGQYQIALVDVLWILLSVTALFVYYKIKPQVQMQSAFNKHPIDYKNLDILKAEELAKSATALQLTEQQLQTKTEFSEELETKIPMRTKIVILWIFLGIGWIVHHIYGLFNIYYNETLIMDGATGKAPTIHHIYRILFEGLCLLFGLLTLEISKKWFIWTSFIWAIIAGLYNVYHVYEAVMYEPSNISEIFMLIVVAVASIFLVLNLNKWRKQVVLT